jgi:DNA invertase Pin-like site-specific DNA recombinase
MNTAPFFIAYYRVSTDRQGASGLGLEAQRQTVADHVARSGGALLAEFTEIESGARKKRPQLHAALVECQRRKATLIIAKLDRLGRNVAFISALMESGAEFVAADNPQATRLLLHLLAAFAEHEREQISQRTKDALAAAKRRGVVLGANGRALGARNHDTAQDFAKSLRPVITAIRAEGHTTVRAIAAELNRREIPPFRARTGAQGARWHCSNTHALLKRLASGG